MRYICGRLPWIVSFVCCEYIHVFDVNGSTRAWNSRWAYFHRLFRTQIRVCNLNSYKEDDANLCKWARIGISPKWPNVKFAKYACHTTIIINDWQYCKSKNNKYSNHDRLAIIKQTLSYPTATNKTRTSKEWDRPTVERIVFTMLPFDGEEVLLFWLCWFDCVLSMCIVVAFCFVVFDIYLFNQCDLCGVAAIFP